MVLFEKLKNFFVLEDRRKTKILKHVYYDQDPTTSWETIKELGDGAFGKVYMMRNLSTKEEAALKKVKIENDLDIDDHAVEINILCELKHPNIVMLQETYFFQDKLWMFLEYCGGGAIDAIMINLDKPLTEPQIACLSLDVCRGLEFLHKNFVIHRDMKASNLLLGYDGLVKIADFGVSAKNESETRGRNTFMGTPYWMAPEVVRCETLKDVPYSYKADIWSFGITLIECAQMNPPHSDMHPMRVLIKITKSAPPTLTKLRYWTKTFQDFLSKCLVKEPESRFSASQLLKHQFVSELKDNEPLKQLLFEATAEVTEEIKEEPDETSLEESESADADAKSSSSSSMNDIVTASEDDDERVMRMVMLGIIEEVITCVNMKPSIPGVVFDTVMEIINDDEGEEQQEQVREPLAFASALELNETCEHLYTKILEEVLQSTNRQPSVSGVVLDVMTDIIKGTEVEESKPAKAPESIPVQVRKPSNQTFKRPQPEIQLSKHDDETEVQKPEIRPGFKRTMTKTRKYVNTDGQLVTMSTTYNLSGDDSSSKQFKAHELRRRDMRDMKLQQKLETKQLLELDSKDKTKFEELANKFERSKQSAVKTFEIESEQISRAGKIQIDKIEETCLNEQRLKEKKFRMEEETTIRLLLEHQKKELKNLKVETSDLNNGMNKKEALKVKKENTMMSQLEKERKVRETLEQNLEMMRDNLKDEYRKRVAEEELKMLQGKQQATKKREASVWKIEEELMKKRHELFKQHIREKFILKRQHMMARHDKEMNSLDEANKESLAELLRQQMLEKRRQPKMEKSDSKVRCQTFKRRMRESGGMQMLEKEKEKIVEFEENERKRLRDSFEKLELKHIRELSKLQTDNQLKVKDLEQIQKNKLKMLMEQENEAIKALEEQFNIEFQEWLERLAIKENQLDESFKKELSDHNNFYSRGLSNKTSVA